MCNRTVTKKYIDEDSEDGDTIEVELPARFEVCDRCHGEGKHVNPSIDGDGITESEWREMCHEDEEFPDKYFGDSMTSSVLNAAETVLFSW